MTENTERPLALITGASSGIGATFAAALAQRGCDLILVARRGERLRELSASLQSKHDAMAEILVADLASDEGVEATVERIRRAPHLDYLVNNAGFGAKGKFFRVPLGPQEQMHRLHILAPLRLMHAALPAMVDRNQGAIINVSSVSAFFQVSGGASYSATKAWMTSFNEGIYMELKSVRSRVRIQSLCPGYTYTEFHDVLGMDRSRIAKSLWMRAEDVVAESLRALDENKLLVVPGWQYKALVALSRFIPQWLRIRFGVQGGKQLARD